MKCETVRPLLYRLIEARLLGSDASAVRGHVEECSKCARRLRQIAALDESAMEAESELPSPNLRPKLLAAYRRVIADRRATSSGRGRWLPAMGRAAVLALVAFGSSSATWVGLRPVQSGFDWSSRAPVSSVGFDHLFPLQLDTSYTILDEDGRTQHGVRIEIVH